MRALHRPVAELRHGLKRVIELYRDYRVFGPAFVRCRLAQTRRSVVRAPSRFGILHFRPNDSDIATLRQVFASGEYDLSGRPQMARLNACYRDILVAGHVPVIVDAGANIGAAAMWFADLFPQAHIAAIEPDSDNAFLARQNTASRKNVELIDAAIGARAGSVTLQRVGESWSSRTVRSESGIRVVTVPDLVAAVPNGRLFIVKVDIEGFEAELFAENVGWVEEAAAIFIEPHDWMLPGAGTSQAFQRALLGTGREILLVGENLAFV